MMKKLILLVAFLVSCFFSVGVFAENQQYIKLHAGEILKYDPAISYRADRSLVKIISLFGVKYLYFPKPGTTMVQETYKNGEKFSYRLEVIPFTPADNWSMEMSDDKRLEDKMYYDAAMTGYGINEPACAMRVIALCNYERAKHGIPPLEFDSTLQNTATVRSQELLTLYSHQRPDGRPAHTAFPYTYIKAFGENIQAGSDSPAGAFASWMNSPGHRAQILNPQMTKTGVAHASDINTEYVHYWCQNFSS